MVCNQVVDRTRSTQINLGRGLPINMKSWTNLGQEHFARFRTRPGPKKNLKSRTDTAQVQIKFRIYSELAVSGPLVFEWTAIFRKMATFR